MAGEILARMSDNNGRVLYSRRRCIDHTACINAFVIDAARVSRVRDARINRRRNGPRDFECGRARPRPSLSSNFFSRRDFYRRRREITPADLQSASLADLPSISRSVGKEVITCTYSTHKSRVIATRTISPFSEHSNESYVA